jgi:hypothetical protein
MSTAAGREVTNRIPYEGFWIGHYYLFQVAGLDSIPD